MAFKKTNNIEMLEKSILDKNYIQIPKETIPREENEEAENINKKLVLNLINLKSNSVDIKHRKSRNVSLRVSEECFLKISKLTCDGMLSQSDIITLIVEKEFRSIDGDENENSDV